LNPIEYRSIAVLSRPLVALSSRGDSRIVVDVFGDGAVNRGPFLEGLNWAVVFDLPILFICEDNRYSSTTRTEDMTGGEGAAACAVSLGLRTTEVDGNDVEALANVSAAIIARLQAGGGPEFLHTLTVLAWASP